MERAERMGEMLRLALAEALHGRAAISRIRGKGLMVGVQFNLPRGDLVGRALARGLLVNVAAGNVLRLLPPLIIGEQEVQRIVKTIAELVHAERNYS